MTEATWTVKAALDWCIGYLADKADEHPRRSAEWLLSAATGLSRVELYAFHDRPLTVDERATLREGVKRRAAGEPLQYVSGEVAFRHIVVKVRPGVLIPRPETEVLVGEALACIADIDTPLVADPCTGSGVVALSIAHEYGGARVFGSDLSATAIEVACDNAQCLRLEERVEFVEGDLLSPLPTELRGRFDLVVSNPPYIPSGDLPNLPAEVAGFEPKLALDGGADGLDIFRRLVVQTARWLAAHGTFVCELDESRVRVAGDEALEWYQDVRVVGDLTGRDRVLVAKAPRRQ